MSNEDKTDQLSDGNASPPADVEAALSTAQTEQGDQAPEQPQDPALNDAELDKVSGGLWRQGAAFMMPTASRPKKKDA